MTAAWGYITWFITCGLTFLHICLMPSKAMLAPPVRLNVRLLDFVAVVEWLPGPGNPPDTRYTLEYIPGQNISGGKWNRSPNCSNITTLKCDLTFDQEPDELFWNYFVRAKTMFKGTSSNWTTMSRSFQPYGDTCLSPPDVNISTDQQTIYIDFSHKLELKPGIKPLQFLLYLYENSSAEKFVAHASTSKSPYIFRNVPPDRNYCVNVSASHQQALRNNNINTTKCILLSDSPGGFSVVMVCIVTVLLILFVIGVALTCVCFCHKSFQIGNLRIPGPLVVIAETKSFFKLSPEKFHIITATWPAALQDTAEDCVSASEEENSQLYHLRESLTNVRNSSSIGNQETSVDLPDPDEGAETLYQYTSKYSLANNIEECEENVVSETYEVNNYPNATVPLFTSTSNLSRVTSSEIPHIDTVNLKVDRDCAEDIEGETCSQSSYSDWKGAVSDEEDVSSWADSSSDFGYEPRSDPGVSKREGFHDL